MTRSPGPPGRSEGPAPCRSRSPPGKPGREARPYDRRHAAARPPAARPPRRRHRPRRTRHHRSRPQRLPVLRGCRPRRRHRPAHRHRRRLPPQPHGHRPVRLGTRDATDGRFRLGLGTQVRAHIERRYNAALDPPGPRIRDYIGAVRACFDACRGAPLDHHSDHYELTLLPPIWSPGPIGPPDPPIDLAAVNPWMLRLAGQVADGVHVHPLNARTYLDDTVAPHLAAEAQRAHRHLDDFEVIVPAFLVVGDTTDECDRWRHLARTLVAFYGSTPNYAFIFDDLGHPGTTAALRDHQRNGDIAATTAVITDDILRHFVTEGTWATIADAIADRYAGLAARVVTRPRGRRPPRPPQRRRIPRRRRRHPRAPPRPPTVDPAAARRTRRLPRRRVPPPHREPHGCRGAAAPPDLRFALRDGEQLPHQGTACPNLLPKPSRPTSGGAPPSTPAACSSHAAPRSIEVVISPAMSGSSNRPEFVADARDGTGRRADPLGVARPPPGRIHGAGPRLPLRSRRSPRRRPGRCPRPCRHQRARPNERGRCPPARRPTATRARQAARTWARRPRSRSRWRTSDPGHPQPLRRRPPRPSPNSSQHPPRRDPRRLPTTRTRSPGDTHGTARHRHRRPPTRRHRPRPDLDQAEIGETRPGHRSAKDATPPGDT
ncbi:MAG: LLM class flavin-dependent oxidoreductase [Microthrixaceae bacterium]|nr:LLM class flavin-dependent oxidoreductase [Microthrixaceae bacterium]